MLSNAREGQWPELVTSDRAYVFRLGTFRALGNGELHLLAFSQSAEPACVDCTIVNENVTATVLSDETKAFGLIEPLYVAGFSIRH